MQGVQAEDDAGWSAYVGSVDATLSDAGVQQALNELARENNDPRQLQVVCLHALERARDAGRGEESSRAVVALTPDALAGAAKHVLSLLNAPAHVLANRSGEMPRPSSTRETIPLPLPTLPLLFWAYTPQL